MVEKRQFALGDTVFELFQLNFIFTILVTLYFLRILTKQKLQQYIAYQNFLIRSIAILL